MGRLYINTTLEKSIRSYCDLNGIEDINAFANRCAMQGFSIIKFGMSPKDNIERENNGIKDIKKNAARKKEEDPPRQDVEEQTEQKQTRSQTDEKEVKPTEERKENVTVRKIRIIKKQ
jgi:hypothetical protein